MAKTQGRGGLLGLVCLGISILVINVLAFYKLYMLAAKGVWVDWMLGNFLPEDLVAGVFTLEPGWLRRSVVWFLTRDVVLYLLPFPVLIFFLDQQLKKQS